MDWPLRLNSAIDALAPQLLEARRRMHMYPEPSGEERGTTDYLAAQLEVSAHGLAFDVAGDLRRCACREPAGEGGDETKPGECAQLHWGGSVVRSPPYVKLAAGVRRRGAAAAAWDTLAECA